MTAQGVPTSWSSAAASSAAACSPAPLTGALGAGELDFDGVARGGGAQQAGGGGPPARHTGQQGGCDCAGSSVQSPCTPKRQHAGTGTGAGPLPQPGALASAQPGAHPQLPVRSSRDGVADGVAALLAHAVGVDGCGGEAVAAVGLVGEGGDGEGDVDARGRAGAAAGADEEGRGGDGPAVGCRPGGVTADGCRGAGRSGSVALRHRAPGVGAPRVGWAHAQARLISSGTQPLHGGRASGLSEARRRHVQQGVAQMQHSGTFEPAGPEAANSVAPAWRLAAVCGAPQPPGLRCG